MHLNGKDVDLIPVKQEFITKRGTQVKKGDHERWYYRFGDIGIQLDRIVSRPCSAKDQECEAVIYDVSLEVKKGINSQTIQTTGDCGC